MTWDEPTSNAIHRDLLAGLSYSQVARKHGTTRGAIAGKVHREGIGRWGWEYTPISRAHPVPHERSGNAWDHRVRESWHTYTARKKSEREQARQQA